MRPIYPSVLVLLFFAPALSAQVDFSLVNQHAQAWAVKKFSQKPPPPDVNPAAIPGRSVQGHETVELVVSGDSGVEGEITAVIDPRDSNNLTVVVMKDTTVTLQFGIPLIDIAFPIYFSRDFGETWQRSGFQPEDFFTEGEIQGGGGDPLLTYDADGLLHLTWLRSSVKTLSIRRGIGNTYFLHATSEDGGETWTMNEESIASRAANFTISFFGEETITGGSVIDKEYIIADTHTGSPNYGNIYLFYTELTFVNSDSVNFQILFHTWAKETGWSEAEVAISREDLPLCSWVSPTIDTDGTVYLSVFGASGNDPVPAQYVVKLMEGEPAFSAPKRIAYFNIECFLSDPQVNAPCVEGILPERTIPAGYLYANPKNNDLYAIWYAHGLRVQTSQGTDVYFSVSEDQGETWSTPTIVNQDTNPEADNFLPTGVIDETGNFHVTWYDQRAGVGSTDYYGATYDSKAQTWKEEFVITSAATDFRTIGNRNLGFGVSDYNTTLAHGDILLPFWADGRSNNGDLDIYLAKVLPEGEIVSVTTLTGSGLSALLSPNPTSGDISIYLTLERSVKGISAVILDAAGKAYGEITIAELLPPGSHTFEFAARHLPSGTYFLALNTATSGQIVKRFIKL